MRIGLHVSIAGSIWESLDRSKALGCDTMQIFSRNPRSWQVTKLAAADVERFRALKAKYDVHPVVIHIPYIINLATPDDVLYNRSIAAYIEDVKRADLLGAEYFVTHLGSHRGSGEARGIDRFAKALNEIIKKAMPKTMLLLENTAGPGDSLGSKFGHLRRIIGALDDRTNVGVCLDTAHTFEAGYDIKTKSGLNRTFKELDEAVGLDLIKVVHFNDSLSELGSHVDRHHHIGKGMIGLEALRRVINHPALRSAAFIMETPKESDKDDRRNLATVRKMIR